MCDECVCAGFLYLLDRVSPLFWRWKNESSHSLVKSFLVTCYATLHPAMSVGWLVPFLLFLVIELCKPTAPAQYPSDLLEHCSCPPARD